jgi:DnaJ-domain-containing protein 1
MEALKAKIRQQQAKQDALEAAQKVQQQQQEQQQEMEQRKSRLNSAFVSAFANAAKAQAERKQQAAAAAAAAAAAIGSDADTEEVKRVLASETHYEVLQLQPGCSSAALKKRYKEVVVKLHPDKCKADQATEAFQRAHAAYQELLKVVL